MRRDKNTEYDIADAAMERPYGFSVAGKSFFLYPLTLGKSFLLQRMLDCLEINQKNMQSDSVSEIFRLVKEQKEDCLSVICCYTFNTPEEHFSVELADERRQLFVQLSDDEIATLMIVALGRDKTDEFVKYLGIDKEQDRISTVMRIKNRGSKNNMTFGGKSLFGTLLDAACERYGWTKQYVVWGIDLVSLRLMLADKITSIYISDDERKSLPASVQNKDEEILKPTKENMQKILSMDWA